MFTLTTIMFCLSCSLNEAACKKWNPLYQGELKVRLLWIGRLYCVLQWLFFCVWLEWLTFTLICCVTSCIAAPMFNSYLYKNVWSK